MPAPRKSRSSSVASSPRRPRKIELRPAVSFGPEVCNNLAAAEQREWLVTNGIGGFASGTVAGSATRRYHGLLVAALSPPGGRTFLAGGVDEVLRVEGQTCSLATHRWASGAIEPQG